MEAAIFAGIIYFWVGKAPPKDGQPHSKLSHTVVGSRAAAKATASFFSIQCNHEDCSRHHDYQKTTFETRHTCRAGMP